MYWDWKKEVIENDEDVRKMRIKTKHKILRTRKSKGRNEELQEADGVSVQGREEECWEAERKE